MMYTMPKNLLSICVNFALATQHWAQIYAIIDADFMPLIQNGAAGKDVFLPWKPK